VLGYQDPVTCVGKTLYAIVNIAEQVIIDTLATIVFSQCGAAGGVGAVVAAFGQVGIEAYLIVLAYELCTDEWCTEDRSADQICTPKCLSETMCTCLADGGQEGFATEGARRSPSCE